MEFLEAGRSFSERVEASLLVREIDRVYLEWGLADVQGLSIDGQPANVASLIDAGPESLCDEALEAIKRVNHLSEEDRKN